MADFAFKNLKARGAWGQGKEEWHHGICGHVLQHCRRGSVCKRGHLGVLIRLLFLLHFCTNYFSVPGEDRQRKKVVKILIQWPLLLSAAQEPYPAAQEFAGQLQDSPCIIKNGAQEPQEPYPAAQESAGQLQDSRCIVKNGAQEPHPVWA